MERPERRGGESDFKAPLDASLLFTFLALGNAPRAFAVCVSAWRTPRHVATSHTWERSAVTSGGSSAWAAAGPESWGLLLGGGSRRRQLLQSGINHRDLFLELSDKRAHVKPCFAPEIVDKMLAMSAQVL